jgi:GH24 family phage-related lysozyme (muramidase)
MKTSQNGLNLIKSFENCELESYQDSKGVWTIGYGHTEGVTKGMTITKAQADAYFVSDIIIKENKVAKYDSTYHWNQNEFDALVSFAFNVGNIKELTASGTRSREVIAEKMLLYCKSGGKILAGLLRRRQEEQKLFLTPVGETVKTANGNTSTYVVGKCYTLHDNMYIRETPDGNKKKYLKLTTNAKSHSTEDEEGYGILKKGTVVTCKGTEIAGDAIWMKIPSGYICAVGKSGMIYVR